MSISRFSQCTSVLVTAPAKTYSSHWNSIERPPAQPGFELVAAFTPWSLTCPSCSYQQLVFLGSVAVMALKDAFLSDLQTVLQKLPFLVLQENE